MADPKKLFFVARQLNAEVRKIYGPKETDDILELQMFAVAAVSVAIYVVPKLPEVDAKGTVQKFGGYAVTELARQWKQQRFKLGAVYQERYAEYAPGLFRTWRANAEATEPLIDALDGHMMGKPTGDPVRQKHLDGLVVTYGGKVAPIFEQR